MSSQQLGFILIVAGAVFFVVGVSIEADGFSWFGHLPGDMTIQRETARLLVPITSITLLAIILTSALRLVASVLRRVF